MALERVILGIETSCDETAAAVVRGRVVLSNVIASQHELHAEYRGVVPEIASRAHAERVLGVVREALRGAGVGLGEVEGVAVGNRPGLIGSLLVGVSAAKGLAWGLGVPCVGVDHVHAHLFAGCMDEGGGGGGGLPGFPALGLVVSGGHTSLYHMESAVRVRRLGGTIDDAIGEAYDKLANMLGLGFPGGPEVDRLAQRGDENSIEFPVSRLSAGSLDFSFSGLKTAALYALRGVPNARVDLRGVHVPPSAADLAASFQRAAVGAVVLKVRRAIAQHPGCRGLLVGGGVSANSRLRRELVLLAKQEGLELRLPGVGLCLDNAAMIAGLGHALLDARGWVGDDLGFPAVPTTGLV
jgi:N6-L-threonylcarbamoyladenine synthase